MLTAQRFLDERLNEENMTSQKAGTIYWRTFVVFFSGIMANLDTSHFPYEAFNTTMLVNLVLCWGAQPWNSLYGKHFVNTISLWVARVHVFRPDHLEPFWDWEAVFIKRKISTPTQITYNVHLFCSPPLLPAHIPIPRHFIRISQSCKLVENQ